MRWLSGTRHSPALPLGNEYVRLFVAERLNLNGERRIKVILMDVHTPAQRSYNMSRIRSRDTKPELIVRSLVHQMGGRFRLHRTDLPGKPDLVLPGRKQIIFVHGCFWHRHYCRYGRVVPKTNADFWHNKRQGTVDRDRRTRRKLRADGWDVLTVWECWTKQPEARLIPRLEEFLNG